VAEFLEQVWAWILDWWWLVLLIGAALAAIIFTRPAKRPERPDDYYDPGRPRRGPPGFG
jgi:hypothetical protein